MVSWYEWYPDILKRMYHAVCIHFRVGIQQVGIDVNNTNNYIDGSSKSKYKC